MLSEHLMKPQADLIASVCSAALHISMRYEDQELDPKQLLIQARAQREALMADALVPPYVSFGSCHSLRASVGTIGAETGEGEG